MSRCMSERLNATEHMYNEEQKPVSNSPPSPISVTTITFNTIIYQLEERKQGEEEEEKWSS